MDSFPVDGDFSYEIEFLILNCIIMIKSIGEKKHSIKKGHMNHRIDQRRQIYLPYYILNFRKRI